ncbi:hypothetical protein [Sphingobacterium yanglingense]|uniref:Uncharacterized protein n=1 Tax=Sphingobacterium yanglingense TaxID=1437280 RepID=A0A4R6W4E1_9SPHI|nr:hypothetical protein [Sphingobacterium yanglingense]TDQ73444.1 hypothetical protein CLV99_4496 [Sphingobacterium yanglingense]
MNKRILTIALLGLPMLFGTNASHAQLKEVSYLTMASARSISVCRTGFEMRQVVAYNENVVFLQAVSCGEYRTNDSF